MVLYLYCFIYFYTLLSSSFQDFWGTPAVAAPPSNHLHYGWRWCCHQVWGQQQWHWWRRQEWEPLKHSRSILVLLLSDWGCAISDRQWEAGIPRLERLDSVPTGRLWRVSGRRATPRHIIPVPCGLPAVSLACVGEDAEAGQSDRSEPAERLFDSDVWADDALHGLEAVRPRWIPRLPFTPNSIPFRQGDLKTVHLPSETTE